MIPSIFSKIKNRPKQYILPFLILIIGCLFSYGIASSLQQTEHKQAQERFENIAAEDVASIRKEISSTLETFKTIEAFFRYSSEVTPEEFSGFTKTLLNNHPNILGIAWYPRTWTDEQDFYFPNLYAELGKGKEDLHDPDFYSAPLRKELVGKLLPDQKIVASTPAALYLSDDRSQENSIAKIPGSIAVGFRVYTKKGLETQKNKDQPGHDGIIGLRMTLPTLLKQTPRRINEAMQIAIFDITETPIPVYIEHQGLLSLLPASFEAEEEMHTGPRVEDSIYCDQLAFADRRWQVLVLPSDHFIKQNESSTPFIVFLMGGMISIFVFIYILLIMNRKDIFEHAVHKRTEELEESNNFLEIIMDTDPNFIFVKDEKLRVVSGNKAFMTLYSEEDRDNIIGTTTFDNFPKDEVELYTAQDLITLEKGSVEYIEDITDHKGYTRTLLTKKTRFHDKKGDGYLLGVCVDISDLKKTENELRRSNKELEQFAYVASHDLKAPLRHISLCSSFLINDYKDQLDPKAQNYLDMMSKSCERMQHMIESVLHFSQIVHDPEDITSFNVQEIIDKVKEDLKTSIEENNATVTVSKMPTIHGSNDLIRQLFQNLIDNALKYKKENTPLKIDVETRLKGSNVMFTVTDNGIGIDKKHAEQIFKIFQRLHNDDEIPGTGIGLSVCQRIVEIHKGKIWLDTDYKDGSRFCFSIPMISP